jgi:hypothetical protein
MDEKKITIDRLLHPLPNPGNGESKLKSQKILNACVYATIF